MTTSLKTILVPIFLLFVFSGYAQSADKELKKSKKEIQFEETKKVVKSGYFIFEAEKAYPLKSKNFLITNQAFLKVKRHSTEANLPYALADLDNIEAPTSPPIHFNASIENYRVTMNEKKYTISISFQTIDNHDTYSVSIQINKLGLAKATISSLNRSQISYTGTLIGL